MNRRTKTTIAVGAVALVGWTGVAGAVQRTDYAGLNDCAPIVTQAQDGQFQFSIPAGCAPQKWHLATFHVPHSGKGWHDGQVQTDRVDPTVVGGARYSFQLRLQPGCWQQDMWLEGEEQVYAAAVFDNGVCDTPPATTTTTAPASTSTSVPVSAPPPTTGLVPTAGTTPPAAPSGGGTSTDTPTPPGATAGPAVLISTPTRAGLPNTGRNTRRLTELGAAAVISGGVFLGLARRSRGSANR